MQRTVDGIKRTFPKKGAGPPPRRIRQPSPTVDHSPVVTKKPKKLSKAKKAKKRAIFAAKIERKKQEEREEKSDEEEEEEEMNVEDMLTEDNEDDNETIQGMTLDGELPDEYEDEEDEEDEPSEGDAHVDVEDRDAFREEIANMPLGKVKQLKEKLGIKLFNKAFFGEDASTAAAVKKAANPPENKYSRDNAKRPREMSSKRPVSKFRNAYANERIEKKRFDPRFDDRCGEYSEFIHRNNYGFLDEMRQSEKQILKKEVKKVEKENPEMAERMRETLRKMNNREKSQAEADRRKEVVREVRRENNQRMQQGLKPIFKTRGELKMRVMEKKFDELKKTHQLDKYIERRSKKQGKKGKPQA